MRLAYDLISTWVKNVSNPNDLKNYEIKFVT